MMLKDKVIEELSNRFGEEFSRSFSSTIENPARRRLFATLFFNSYELEKNFLSNLDPFALVALEQRMNQIRDWLQQEAFAHFFGYLYQIEYSLDYHNRSELQNRLQWTISDLHTAYILMLTGDNLTDSLGSCFFERLRGLVTVDCKLIDAKDKEFYKLAVINLCNVNDVLNYYVGMGNADQKYKDLAKSYMKLSFLSLKRTFLDAEKPETDINLSLYVYATVQNCAKVLDEKIEELQDTYEELENDLEAGISKLRPYNSILSLCDLYYLNKEKFTSFFEEVFEQISTKIDWINRPFYIKMMIFYLLEKGIGAQPIKLKIRPTFNPLNMDEITEKLFPEYFLNKSQLTITSDELEKLMTFDDAEIRKKLTEIFQRSSYITTEEKERLTEESKKPHTGGEISDFEVHMKIGPHNQLICLPIKSGREITVSVPEKYAYQIMKPFVRLFDRCVVIFLTSRRCSQALDGYIKQLKTLYGFPIDVIQEGYLARIFKFYAQL
jgi:hypothetical protein